MCINWNRSLLFSWKAINLLNTTQGRKLKESWNQRSHCLNIVLSVLFCSLWLDTTSSHRNYSVSLWVYCMSACMCWLCSAVSLDSGPQRTLRSPDTMTDRHVRWAQTNVFPACWQISYCRSILIKNGAKPKTLVLLTSWLEMKCLVYLDRDVTRAPLLPATGWRLVSRHISVCLVVALAAGKPRHNERVDDCSEWY